MKTNYKMRAECSADLGRFLMEVSIVTFTATSTDIDGAWIPDMEVTFTSILHIDEIRAILANIVDGHVMLESLNLAQQYTGERYHGHLFGDQPVKEGPDGRWFITMGHAGFNSPANNRSGYASKESALRAHKKYASK